MQPLLPQQALGQQRLHDRTVLDWSVRKARPPGRPSAGLRPRGLQAPRRGRIDTGPTYDANGNLDTIRDPEGRTTTYGFQADGQITKVPATTYTDPTGNIPLLVGCAVGGLIDGALDWGAQRLGGRKVNWGQVGRSAATGCAFGMLGGLGNLKRVTSAGCVPGNSFTVDTPALMADGTRKPIQQIRVGDQVLAGDPNSATSRSGKVTALIQGSGDEQLIDVVVDGKSKPLTATEGHPFWVDYLQQWLPAGELKVGQWLATGSGTRVHIASVHHRTERTAVYHLTVEGPHTYYVGAAGFDVLVHNSTPGCGPHLALGLLHIRGGERHILESFARRVGAVTYRHDVFGLTPGASMNSDMVARTIDTVASRGGYMSFNMRGINVFQRTSSVLREDPSG
ncbi:polymorphic toxin-type HINT domain-containing protein [Streptomyces sp. NPDC058049]|uniref:polymorphic toxin-type HINT domain-containing protein n=1 Tax=Streptomyces sp. NPDC058049 TaxID=3346314 RepID=UPI0036E554FA